MVEREGKGGRREKKIEGEREEIEREKDRKEREEWEENVKKCTLKQRMETEGK